ncbi:hypothetical protein [uncultured Rikenella sp.]|uniref:hypothetical protein n=1 Tax=uncultured Rikenella sp. TaxID=368003 RepID=UPI002612F286|nr:hypothetical protein [uncultured Rikenella sp.]
MPLKGTFPYYSDGVPGESYGSGHYKATNGRLYKVSTSGAGTPLAWYPAPGFRNYSTGALGAIGSEGTVWSASVPDDSTNAWRLLFHATNMDPSHAYNRGYGFQLRCLSE